MRPIRERHGAGLILYSDDNASVLLQRKDANFVPFPHALSIIGGAMEPGEAPIDALRRECMEELRWTLPDDASYYQMQADWRLSQHSLHIHHLFSFHVDKPGTLDRLVTHEGAGLEWIEWATIFGGDDRYMWTHRNSLLTFYCNMLISDDSD